MNTIGKTETVTACIFVLPGQEQYTEGDPKQVLRNAFARTGRVVQFITPEENGGNDKIRSAVYDLYRQLGVVALLDSAKVLPPLANTPCVGMHLCTQVHGIANRARFLPVYVTVNIPEGKTRVQCDAFRNELCRIGKPALKWPSFSGMEIWSSAVLRQAACQPSKN